ncbi:DUF6531 domain-containing protein [Pseudomonas viridiflava]|uniref:DUF6531 domain-containing protein n=1 Tax=Pseudomonas viridiflava TaxID=33069 RepID=UPI001F11E7CC|nr:DUF6531 domain-containing protein [Pseudomonas viridiflava]
MSYKMIFRFLLGLLLLSVLQKAIASEFKYWMYPGIPNVVFENEMQGCEYLYSAYFWSSMADYYEPSYNRYVIQGADKVLTYQCGYKYGTPPAYVFGDIYFLSVSCENGSMLDRSVAGCAYSAQKGRPENSLACKVPSSFVGNPINFANGNKYEEEVDLAVGEASPILVSRSYNSMDGRWRHSYSSSLIFGEDAVVVVVNADGRQASFTFDGVGYLSATDNGKLQVQQNGWVYQYSSGGREYFSLTGVLLKKVDVLGREQRLEYIKSGVDRRINIQDDSGRNVRIVEDPLAQLKSITYGDREFAFEYDVRNHLVSKREIIAGVPRKQRIYHYEVDGKEGLLTGITDERGVRYATWSYDLQGRAITSEHSGGAGRVQVTYKSDAISSVVNELGKSTVYSFERIGGVKRIISIEGEPSPNCSVSNSRFTYNERGQVLTKTDAKGQITTYDYNGRGLETSRTEASGTTLARTVTTEWDPERFLPIRVTEPDRITTYGYDVQGREISRQSVPR